MACCIAVAVQCHAPKVVLYDYGTGQKETIDRKIIEHEIRNPDLKRLLKEFDDTYDDSTEVRGEGLNLSCDIYSDSICYTIDYTTNISYAGPTIVCEPVNGKEVTMTVRDLWNDIRLLPARSNELLKDSNPEEYRERLLVGMASCCGSSVKSGISAGAGRNGGHSGTKSGPAGRVLTGVMSCPVWPDGVADMQRPGIGRRLKAPGLYGRGCRFAVRGDIRRTAALAFGLHVGAKMIRRIVSSIGFPTDRFAWPDRAARRAATVRFGCRACASRFPGKPVTVRGRIRCLPKGGSAAAAECRGRSLSAGRAGGAPRRSIASRWA